MQPFTIMCKQTATMHVVKQLKPQQLKEPMYDCDQHLCNSQAIHPIAITNWLAGYISQG